MSTDNIDARFEELEDRVRKLENEKHTDAKPWWERISGAFKDEQTYAEAMKLGKQHRDDQASP